MGQVCFASVLAWNPTAWSKSSWCRWNSFFNYNGCSKRNTEIVSEAYVVAWYNGHSAMPPSLILIQLVLLKICIWLHNFIWSHFSAFIQLVDWPLLTAECGGNKRRKADKFTPFSMSFDWWYGSDSVQCHPISYFQPVHLAPHCSPASDWSDPVNH